MEIVKFPEKEIEIETRRFFQIEDVDGEPSISGGGYSSAELLWILEIAKSMLLKGELG